MADIKMTYHDWANIVRTLGAFRRAAELHSEIEAGRLIERRLAMAGDLAKVQDAVSSPLATEHLQRQVAHEERTIAEFDAVYPLIAARALAIIEARKES